MAKARQKARKIEDKRYGGPVMKVVTKSQTPKKLARDIVICGCGVPGHKVEVAYNSKPSGDVHTDVIEINGVTGTIAQWREYWLPKLGYKPETIKVGGIPKQVMVSGWLG
jgi:hypothetical protein